METANMSKRILVALLILIAAPAAAHEARIGDILILHPWARATPGAAANGAAYLKIENQGATHDRLIAAAADVAARVELHAHIVEDGVAKMRQVEAIDAPAGAAAELAPGGYHIMLMELKQPLKAGETFPLTLTFEKAGSIELQVAVEAAGATEPAH
jgi:copper(I)-binding protein